MSNIACAGDQNTLCGLITLDLDCLQLHYYITYSILYNNQPEIHNRYAVVDFSYLFRVPFALPSSFIKKRQKPTSSGKKKFQEWDRDVMCIPKSYASGSDVTIPRGQSRTTLASKGLAGKIRLNSHMTEEDIFAEFRSVFSKAMKNNENFQFEILQSPGGGSKSLVIPCRSSNFKWTARQVIASAGRGYIYILAKEDLFFVKEEEKVMYLTIIPLYSHRDG